MRTVHTEPTPAVRLRVGDTLSFCPGRLPYTRTVTSVWHDGEIWLDGMGQQCSDWSEYPLVVSAHSEAALFAPDGALF